MNFNIFRSKTFWGAVVVAVAHVIGAPPEQRATAAVEAIGGVVAAWGARGAIAKNGNGS